MSKLFFSITNCDYRKFHFDRQNGILGLYFLRFTWDLSGKGIRFFEWDFFV